MKTTSLRVLAALTSVAVFALGCETASEGNTSLNVPASENSNTPAPATTPSSPSNPSTTPNAPSSPSPSDSTASAPVAGDQVSYGAFQWKYGGFNGSGASPTGVSLSGLKLSSGSLSFKYNTNLSAWGYGYDDHTGAIACFFVQTDTGAWVGGKFDWISSSRSSRSLDHVTSLGYGGWTLKGVPNPCQAAFVIVEKGGKRRSNVIAGTWKR